MLKRIAALSFIFLCTTAAWMILGANVFHRTYSSGASLHGRVASIWGGAQQQRPAYACTVKGGALPLERTRIQGTIDLEHRQKGLLWYNTYKVGFQGAYTFRNKTAEDQEIAFILPLPAQKAVYDGLRLDLDGKRMEIAVDGSSARAKAMIPAGAAAILTAAYSSQGLDQWRYDFGSAVTGVDDFELRMQTNFAAVDFSDDALAPTTKRRTARGWDLTWKYSSLVSGFNISIDIPSRLQPGQLVGEISYFAPVSLFFFFFVILMITTLSGIDLHPMNYFFLAASFFAFHLLLAYLADHLDIHAAFGICSAVSIGLVVSYLRIVVGPRFAFRQAAAAQFVYLVLFSYAFFLEGFTGLAVAVGSIVTLFVVMQVTARIRWSEKFRVPPPPLPQGS
ncbi:MAG TPA: inner membrane CreD family protein [Bryobacteraceae bacterium]|nr:inner membrane CreD family protein [Bryobacteraceae bacterium]